MMKTIMLAAAVAAGTAGAAAAQSINIDFMRASGPGAGAPAASFPGAAGQPGHWNGIVPSSTQTSTTLTAINGTTGAWVVHRASNGSDSAAFGAAGFANLMADYAFGFTQSGEVEMTFHGLEPGYYRVLVYAGLPESEAYYQSNGQTLAHRCYLGAFVNGSILAGIAQTAGYVGGEVFEEGVNYAELRAGVPEGGTLTITASADPAYWGAKVAVNGVQLVKWPGTVVYVKPQASGDGSGRDWANAMGDLQAAIDMAGSSNGALREVWVAAGTYKPALNDRTRSIRLRSGVRVRGGFAGTESAPEQRDGSHHSVLSGNIGNVLSTGDNSYTVVRFDGPGWAGLDSFTVRDGRAFGPEAGGHNLAGGMVVSAHGVTIENCTFENNTGEVAGAVYLGESQISFDYMVVQGCTFRGNATDGDGGGVAYFGWSAHQFDLAALYVDRCRFEGNWATGSGGGLYVDASQVYVNGSLFNGNTAGEGGAIRHATGQGFNANSCTVTNNHAGQLTGGIVATTNEVRLAGTILWGNTGGEPNSTVYRQLRVHPASAVRADYSCVQGISGVYQGTNLTNVNPRFVDLDGADNAAGTADDDLRLADDSPLIDAGVDFTGALDLAGLPRRVDNLSVADTGYGNGLDRVEYVDMGCFENQSTGTPPACPADWNGDGNVNSADISAFLASWLASVTTGDLAADFNHDGSTNSADISAFLAEWVAAVSGGC